MKFQFMLLICSLLTTSIVFSRKSGGGYKEAIHSCDAYIDSTIENVLLENEDYFDPHPINESLLSFRKKIIFVDFNGEAKVSEGVISGLRNIHRVSSCSLSFENQRLKLSSKLQIDHMYFNFTGSVKVMKMGPVITVIGNSSTVEIDFSFTMNATTGKESLIEELEVVNIKDITVRIEGLRLLNWMNEGLKNSAGQFFKALTERLVERDMRALIAEKMIENPFSIEEFEIDLDEIRDTKTTTELDDTLIEGKLVYTKEDSNSYMDSVIENRFLLEAHYSKLDPYAVEDDRLENVITSSKNKENYIELTNGWLESLTKMKRIQDCTQPVLRASNITFTCYLGFDTLKIFYNAKSVNGEEVSEFDLISLIVNTRLSTKITTTVKDNVPSLIDFNLNHLGKFTVKTALTIADAPILFADTSYDKEKIMSHFSETLKKVLLGRLREVLSYSIYKTPIHFIM